MLFAQGFVHVLVRAEERDNLVAALVREPHAMLEQHVIVFLRMLMFNHATLADELKHVAALELRVVLVAVVDERILIRQYAQAPRAVDEKDGHG